jgi:hypothetical protein
MDVQHLKDAPAFMKTDYLLSWARCLKSIPSHSIKILSRFRGCDYRRGMDWRMGLLNSYTHHSELQVITALSLISTIHISLHTKSSQSSLVSWQRLLTMEIIFFVTAARAKLLSAVNSTTAPSLLSLPCRAQLHCETSSNRSGVRVRVTLRLAVTANQFVLATSPLRLG